MLSQLMNPISYLISHQEKSYDLHSLTTKNSLPATTYSDCHTTNSNGGDKANLFNTYFNSVFTKSYLHSVTSPLTQYTLLLIVSIYSPIHYLFSLCINYEYYFNKILFASQSRYITSHCLVCNS